MQRQGRPTAMVSALCAAALGLAWAVTQVERSRTARLRRDAVVAHERVVQDLAAAKWAIEAGQPQSGLEIVTNALSQAQDAVMRMRQDVRAGRGCGPGRRR